MRCDRHAPRLRAAAPVAAALLLLAAAPARQAPRVAPVHQQRYSMGTMFDVVVYHASRTTAARAAADALDEVDRLDRLLSHYRTGSELSRLVREGVGTWVTVSADLFDVLETSIALSRRSAGTFDVTIGPLVKVWQDAEAAGRRPPAGAIAAARRCVGYELIETSPPNRVRLRSGCMALDLGGIGKGYAVDRALARLAGAGIEDALVNAGGSSIAAIGSPPDASGWPVALPGSVAGGGTLRLRNASISTSQQKAAALPLDGTGFGEILDPATGAPAAGGMAISVVAPSATVSDALSTAIVMLPRPAAEKLLGQYENASAIWASGGRVTGLYPEGRLQLSTP